MDTYTFDDITVRRNYSGQTTLVRLRLDLQNSPTEASLQGLKHIRRNRRTTGSDDSHLAAQQTPHLKKHSQRCINAKQIKSTHLSEYQGVVQPVGDFTSLSVMLNLCRQGLLEQGTLETAGLYLGEDRLVDPVQHSGHGREEFRLDDLCIFKQFEVVSGTVCNDSTRSDGEQLQRPLRGARK